MKKIWPSSCLGRMFLTLVSLYLLLFWVGIYLESPSVGEKETDTMDFPTGEILTNTSLCYVGMGVTRRNQLAFQETSTSPVESVALIKTFGSVPLSVETAKLVHLGSLPLAIGLNDCLFTRHILNGKPYWSEYNTMADVIAPAFVQSLGKTNTGSIGNLFSSSIFLGKPIYEFDRLDAQNRVLVIKRSLPDFPQLQYLVYSEDAFNSLGQKTVRILHDWPWHFDLLRTRQINGLTPPEDPHLTLEVSVITVPDEFNVRFPDREYLLSHAGAKELLDESFPLSSTEWKAFDYQYWNTNLKVQTTNHIEVLFGFKNAEPGDYTICLRGLDDKGVPYSVVQADTWNWVNTRYAKGRGFLFLRIQDAK